MDRYKREGLLGKGAFGEVYEVKDIENPQLLLACKIIGNSNKKLAQKEIHYLRQLTRASHNTTLQYVNHFTTANHIVIVTEQLGISLFDIIKKNNYQGLPIKSIKNIMDCLFSALGWVHDQNIIHSDIKPENMLLDIPSMQLYMEHGLNTRLHFKLIDFGSSTNPNHLAHSYIQSRFYRAPEVMLGARYDSKIDIWSSACVMMECLTGKPLFDIRDEWELLDRCIGLISPRTPLDHDDFKPIDHVIRRLRRELEIFGGVPDVDESGSDDQTQKLKQNQYQHQQMNTSKSGVITNSHAHGRSSVVSTAPRLQSSASSYSINKNFVSKIPRSPEKPSRISRSSTMSSLATTAKPLAPLNFNTNIQGPSKRSSILHSMKSKRQSFIPIPIREIENESRLSNHSRITRSTSYSSLTASLKASLPNSLTLSINNQYHRKKAFVNKHTILFRAFTASGTLNYPYLHHKRPDLKYLLNSWSIENIILDRNNDDETIKKDGDELLKLKPDKKSVGEIVLAFENVSVDNRKRSFNEATIHKSDTFNEPIRDEILLFLEVVERCLVWDKWNRPNAWEILEMNFFKS